MFGYPRTEGAGVGATPSGAGLHCLVIVLHRGTRRLVNNRERYRQATDLEKIQSQWDKLSGLHSRKEWAAVIVRAATAAEIATNFAIRTEFASRSQFDAGFIDSLLIWANGIDGKLNRLLIPMCRGVATKERELQALKARADRINKERNAIVHRGEFRNEAESQTTMTDAQTFVEGLIRLYEPGFTLDKKKK